MATRSFPPLDNTHQAFKRQGVLGPGPRGRKPIKAKGIYECHEIEPYEQMCVLVKGKGAGQQRKISTDPAWKQKYNDQYAAERTRRAPSNDYRKGHVITPPRGKKLKIYEAGKASMAKGRAKVGRGTSRRGRR